MALSVRADVAGSVCRNGGMPIAVVGGQTDAGPGLPAGSRGIRLRERWLASATLLPVPGAQVTASAVVNGLMQRSVRPSYGCLWGIHHSGVAARTYSVSTYNRSRLRERGVPECSLSGAM